jgi:lysozyme
MKNIIATVLMMMMSFSLSASAYSTECKVNEQGVALIKHYEGFEAHAYIDQGSGKWAVGYGAQAPHYKIGPNTVWTKEKADRELRKELNAIAETLCDNLTAPITSNELAALISISYNVGTVRVLKSDLFRHLNNMEPKLAADGFMQYVKSRGKVLRGLKFRRKLEKTLFSTPDFVHIDIKATAEEIYRGRT